MFLSFQNFIDSSKIIEEILVNSQNIVDLNLRNSAVEKLEGYFPELQTLDLKNTKSLKYINIKAPKLHHIFLGNSTVEILKIESSELLEINIKHNFYIKEIDFKTEKLEHIEFDSEKLSENLVSYLLNINSLKGLNHIYNSNNILPKIIGEFKILEKEIKNHKVEKSKNCSCSLCNSFKL